MFLFANDVRVNKKTFGNVMWNWNLFSQPENFCFSRRCVHIKKSGHKNEDSILYYKLNTLICFSNIHLFSGFIKIEKTYWFFTLIFI